jgi:Protein of unknown function (DUF1064)
MLFKRKHKYNAQKIIVDGVRFDSKLEAYTYVYLKKYDFYLQHKFTLQNKFSYTTEKKQAIREIRYKADFYLPKPFFYKKKYFTGLVVETKGMATPEYKIKKKLFLFQNQELFFVEVHSQKEVKQFISLFLEFDFKTI